MTKLLMYGHWSHTGFGVVTEALATRFLAAGIDVRILAMNHRGEPIEGPLAGRVYPLEFIATRIAQTEARGIEGSLWSILGTPWKPDAVLVVADMSGLLGYIGEAVEHWRTIPVWHYCPVEGDNLQPLWGEVWKFIKPVAMSDYGQRQIAELTGTMPPRIYHGVDTEAFRPVTPGNPLRVNDTTLRTKDDCKVAFGIDPARKMLLRADRNAARKRYDLTLRAFAEIAKADADVDLILHCQPVEQDGLDLWQEILRLPEDIRGRVKFTNLHDTFRGLSTEGLAALYNAADIYLTTTSGEGFGLTLAESLACGVPVVTTGWAAETEVVAKGGVLVPPLRDSYGEPVRDHSRFGMDWAYPDWRGFVEPTVNLLKRASWRRDLGAEGRAHVISSFSWDEAAPSFMRLFEDPDANRVAA